MKSTVKEILEEWVGLELTVTSLYGVRVYTEGAILAPHVDRNPLITSSIINVDQDVDEPWPIEVYGHDGIAHNVTMEPGDLVLYESHSVVHGRPFPLKGREFANVFVHFQPAVSGPYAEGAYKIDPDWTFSFEGDRVTVKPSISFLAGTGDLDSIRGIVEGANSDEVIHARDENGWQAIHEAARSGHLDVLKYLVEKGADINSKTGAGDTPTQVVRKHRLFDEKDLEARVLSWFSSEGAEL